MKTIKMKLNMKIIALLTILVTVIATFTTKIKGKLQEQKGADGSSERTGWIIGSLIIVGLLITFVNKFFPELFGLIGDKMKEMFNLIKIN